MLRNRGLDETQINEQAIGVLIALLGLLDAGHSSLQWLVYKVKAV